MTADAHHIGVLLKEVTSALRPQKNGIYVDGTFGSGSYSKALLEAADCEIWAIDRDPLAKSFARQLSDLFPGKIKFLQGCYGDMIGLIEPFGVTKVDGIVLDLGVSSMQLDDPSRGFSFRYDGPLDMRMSSHGATAADIINRETEQKLSEIIFQFGEERASRKVAREIVSQRKLKPITTTFQFANIIRKVVRRAKDGLDPATRTFQALRIYVNHELEELGKGLAAAEKLLVPGGRLAVVSFHSLEDRKVKTMMKQKSGQASRPSRHLPVNLSRTNMPTFNIIRHQPITPSAAELEINSRARSARLRVAERTVVSSSDVMRN